MSEVKIKRVRQRPVVFIALLFLVTGAWLGYQVFVRQYTPVDPHDITLVDVVIPEQATARQIAQQLKKEGLIYSENAFLVYIQKNNLANRLKAGHYRFSRSQRASEMADDIAQGRVVTVGFTIPEGYTLQQIGRLLVERKICTGEEWDAAVKADYPFDFLDTAPSEVNSPLEGFLFPDTYYVSEDCTVQQIIMHMLDNFKQVWDDQFAREAEQRGMDIRQVITMASLIEKEAMVAKERKIISGVIHNRLRKNMLLQIDATVLYCLPEHKEVVTYADLKVDSPYNTYRYPGLPPGPIANPGQASIEAALHPDRNDYLYYVATGDGSHHFSTNYEDHLQAKEKYID